MLLLFADCSATSRWSANDTVSKGRRKIVTVVGSSYCQPIADLLDKLLARRRPPPNKVKRGTPGRSAPGRLHPRRRDTAPDGEAGRRRLSALADVLSRHAHRRGRPGGVLHAAAQRRRYDARTLSAGGRLRLSGVSVPALAMAADFGRQLRGWADRLSAVRQRR